LIAPVTRVREGSIAVAAVAFDVSTDISLSPCSGTLLGGTVWRLWLMAS
jgi:hypothetical protein